MFPIPCCCERSVDLKIFDNKENNIKPMNLIHPLTKESIRRTLSSKIRAQLKINVNNSSINGCRHHLSYHSSPRTNICALENCKKSCNEGNKKVVKLNTSHDFYKKIYLPNRHKRSLILGLDAMFWSLGISELNSTLKPLLISMSPLSFLQGTRN